MVAAQDPTSTRKRRAHLKSLWALYYSVILHYSNPFGDLSKIIPPHSAATTGAGGGSFFGIMASPFDVPEVGGASILTIGGVVGATAAGLTLARYGRTAAFASSSTSDGQWCTWWEGSEELTVIPEIF